MNPPSSILYPYYVPQTLFRCVGSFSRVLNNSAVRLKASSERAPASLKKSSEKALSFPQP